MWSKKPKLTISAEILQKTFRTKLEYSDLCTQDIVFTPFWPNLVNKIKIVNLVPRLI